MSKKTCILPLRYLNFHTVAFLCTVLYIAKYIYKIKKELCESEQQKYLNSKLALALYKFEVRSLQSVRFLHCFPSHLHDFIQISNIMLLFLLIVQKLMFCSFLEYLKHRNICFFSIECRKRTKRGQNGPFLTMRSFFDPCMPSDCFQTFNSWYLLCSIYHQKVSQGSDHSPIYDKSLYAEF